MVMINQQLLPQFDGPTPVKALFYSFLKINICSYSVKINIASTYYLSVPPHELQPYLGVQSARSVQGNMQRSNITQTKINHYPFVGSGQ